MSDGIMEMGKWFLSLISFMALLYLAIFFFQISDKNNYLQQVNYEIERQGGLTTEAVENLTSHSNEYYGGRYAVKSDQLNQKVGYGEIVNYTIEATISIDMFNLPSYHIEFPGSAVSQVR